MLRLRVIFLPFFLLLAVTAVAAPPAPNAPSPKPPVASAPAGSYYGTRDSPTSDTSGDAATAGAPTLNPLAQAWRAFEALVIVLAIIVGVLFALKRFGWVKSGEARVSPGSLRMASGGDANALSLRSSLTLPGAGGATVHILSVGGQTLLLGASPQGVTVLAEWESEVPREAAEETWEDKMKFDDYLHQAGIAPEPPVPARAAAARITATVGHLQTLLKRSRSRKEEEAR